VKFWYVVQYASTDNLDVDSGITCLWPTEEEAQQELECRAVNITYRLLGTRGYFDALFGRIDKEAGDYAYIVRLFKEHWGIENVFDESFIDDRMREIIRQQNDTVTCAQAKAVNYVSAILEVDTVYVGRMAQCLGT